MLRIALLVIIVFKISCLASASKLYDAEFNKLYKACIKNANLKNSEKVKIICKCVTRNHKKKISISELKVLINIYESPGKEYSSRKYEALLDFDESVAEKCVENPDWNISQKSTIQKKIKKTKKNKRTEYAEPYMKAPSARSSANINETSNRTTASEKRSD